jgi:L,D-transpeptidase catalytic domain
MVKYPMKMWSVFRSTDMPISRRSLLEKALVAAALVGLPAAYSWGEDPRPQISPVILRGALDALMRHGASIAHHDVMGIADFSLPSSAPRFHLLNLADGGVRSHLVAHGRGSDPAYTGWLERFSNEPHSYATSAGAFRTQGVYIGEHGHSIRLDGLDASNSNAASRAIVVHGAWYVSGDIAKEHGAVGRSEGCFAMAPSSIAAVLASLGSGRLIYAGKA